MSQVLRRVAFALGGALLASAALGATTVAPAASRPAAATGACSDVSGVTVVVDFGAAGGGVQTRCAPGPVASGFDALSKAGFEITNVRSQPGFLCQIDAIPTSDCSRIPSASRYWSYWHAARGEAWVYSTSGASRRPPAGSVEGWAFGAGTPPSAASPAPIATTTTVRSALPPTPSTSAPAPPATVATGDSAPLGADAPTTSTTAAAGPLEPTGATSTTQLSGARAAVAGTLPGPSAASISADEGSGSAAGLIAAGGLVAAVAVIGVRTARRRARDVEGQA